MDRCRTDQDLFNVALAAAYNGHALWLMKRADDDLASPYVWRQKRGVLLKGLSNGNSLPVTDAWPAGEIRTDRALLRRKAAHFRWNKACAHHWWLAYLAAQNAAGAYAAWVPFQRSADARVWTWMREDVPAPNAGERFFKLKLTHIQLNRSSLERAMEKRVERLGEKFLGLEIVAGVDPWRKARSRSTGFCCLVFGN